MRSIKSMRELELVKENMSYKVLHLENKLKRRSNSTVSAATHQLKEIAFDAGLKIILNLFFRDKKGDSSEAKS